jgi:phosphomethylpyrimidine synthase
MKRTGDVRKYAAEQGVSEEETLKRGMEEKSKEFVERPFVASIIHVQGFTGNSTIFAQLVLRSLN